MLNDTSRGYFEERAKQEGNSALGQAMRRWLANPNDGAAADEIEANPLEVGLTRTRCVATMLEGGPCRQRAAADARKATVNCRIMPGVDPKTVQAELQQLAGPKVEVTPDPNYIGMPTPPSPLRPDVLKAVTARDPALPRAGRCTSIPLMSTGASDGSFFRARASRSTTSTAAGAFRPTTSAPTASTSACRCARCTTTCCHWEMIFKALAG